MGGFFSCDPSDLDNVDAIPEGWYEDFSSVVNGFTPFSKCRPHHRKQKARELEGNGSDRERREREGVCVKMVSNGRPSWGIGA